MTSVRYRSDPTTDHKRAFYRINEVISTSVFTSKVLNMRNSIIGKIIILFVLMFVLLLIPAIVQNVTSYQQTQLYGEMLDNIIYANRLNLDVVENIEPMV